MLQSWRILCLLVAGSLLPSLSLAGPSFENTAVVRTIELGGSVVHVSTTYAIKALEAGQTVYHIALAKDEKEKTSWMEAKVKGQANPLVVTVLDEDDAAASSLIAVNLPRQLSANGTLNLVFESVQTHATRPHPERAAQTDPQLLNYETGLFVLSPYNTLVQRTKVKSLSPDVISYSTPQDVDEFVRDGAVVTKSGATITYGPYHNIHPSADVEFVSNHQQTISVHYNFDYPVLEVKNLERSIEISHWGANLNVEDKIHLYNAGPALKGQFSRLEYQSQNFFGRLSPHTLNRLILQLPPGVTNVYYYDLNGNVSTSNLRVAPSVPKNSKATQNSILDMRPRYPLLGGWNYSFTLGFDTPLQDSVSWDAANGKYIVAVPVTTHIPGSVVDEAIVKIIMPEGASNIEFISPFPALSSSASTHITYLDTIGRPAVALAYKKLTGKHTGMIYVSYSLPFFAHLRKPLAVGTMFFGLFMLGFTAKRVDLRLHRR
ncbi:Ribophorin I [Pisolithus orientalis]|uniref:Ribophorin I n=1 Tax=Pisolithus orientalis TaxID=936130 RepID=UPI002224AAFA|nr:Ribophorin I [Pisolithus orientalis]KAI6035371.1 Ribophorin I [Pisolithus orientalis]